LRSEMRRMLEARIDALPDSCRAVFVLRALEGLPVDETAAALGLSPSRVRTCYSRARGLLRESLVLEIERGLQDAFGCAGARCERIVRNVLKSIKATT
jgi:RNA polymerase sigma-70 factor, ECF subfamily